MKIDGQSWRSIWVRDGVVHVIDQTRLPHRFEAVALADRHAVEHAIRTMVVRGAPLIGVTGAYGLALAMREDPSDAGVTAAAQQLIATRPTAVNLRWAVEQVRVALLEVPPAGRERVAFERADALAEADVRTNAAIGWHGAALLRARWEALGKPDVLNVLTHCNAGWIACVDWGTALAAIYRAHDDGVPVHVWVDETRPRNQGAGLTMWELASHGVPATLIVDNAGGLLMREGKVDAVIVGADRVTGSGDVCNKIGTYLKALAACDNAIPFYVALPRSTIDRAIDDGQREIEIEQRQPDEVTHVWGRDDAGVLRRVLITPEGARAANPAFDVTPARLVSALITEAGVVRATPQGVASLSELVET